MNKRSIATVSLSGTLDEKLRAIAVAGFQAVEIFENDLLSFPGRAAQAREVRPSSIPRLRGMIWKSIFVVK